MGIQIMSNNSYIYRAIYRLRNPLFPYWTAGAYGFKRWISRYGYYPSFLPLCIYTDHGPGDSDLSPAKHELESDAPVQFYHCPAGVTKWKKQSKKECHVLFSPFVFARTQIGLSVDERSGSVYFATHGTEATQDLNPIDLYLKELASVPDRYKPIKICLHINEMRLGYDESYIKYGYEVVTAGDPLDQGFTERFYRILSTTKYAFSPMFGSYALYAVEMGVPFGLYGTNPEYFNKSDPNIEYGHYTSYLRSTYYQQAMALFSGLSGERVTPEQLAFARYYLGVADGVNRPKMAWILYKALGIWLWGKFKKLVSRRIHNST